MKKKLLLIIIISLFVAGCGIYKNKTTTSQFKVIASELGYEVIDKTKALNDKRFKKVILAKKNNDCQIEYYKLKSINDALYMFNDNKNIFKVSKTETSSYTSKNIGNYNTYELTNESNYMYLCRVEDTLIYLKVDVAYKDDVLEFIDNLDC